MALRDQPYLPLYIQDIMTDEKLNECCAATHGIYIKGIMCLMHKSEEYGKILLKQKDQQTDNSIRNFAAKIQKHVPYSVQEIEAALFELIAEKVVYIEGNSLCQKRMIEDNAKSEAKAKAGKISAESKKTKGKKSVATKRPTPVPTKPATSSENETEYETESNSEDDELYGKCENFFHGAVPDDLRELAGKLIPMPDADEWQDYVQREIEKLGYTVLREQPCEYKSPSSGKTVAGRIDLVAGDGETEIGIELDYRQPRLKSIRKVEKFEAGMVLLRDAKTVHVVKADVPVKPFVRTFTAKPDKATITDIILNDEIYVENLQMIHRGKNIAQAWEECWLHFTSGDPPPPNDPAWWKQKLNSWLSNKKSDNGTSKNRKQQHTDRLDEAIKKAYSGAFTNRPDGGDK